MADDIVFNGKFYSASMTGVHRVAEELLRALDPLIEGEAGFEIALPSDAKARPSFRNIQCTGAGLLPWIPWEQLELPLRARKQFLVNLCNLGPLLNSGGLTMIHDAQVYISPQSYSRAFVAWYKLALPTLARRSACVLTVSDYSKRMLVEHGVVTADRVRVIPNGVDHMLRHDADFRAFNSLGLQDTPYVLALANTQAHKNIGVLLRVFSRNEAANLKLVLMGGASKADFERAGMTVPANTIFAGRVSDAELRGLMERALCFACPSLTEGFGLPPLEAMILKCPAVISPNGALPEACGTAALQADPDAPDAWSEAFQFLLANPVAREELAAAGLARASQFTWATSAGALLAAIEEFNGRP